MTLDRNVAPTLATCPQQLAESGTLDLDRQSGTSLVQPLRRKIGVANLPEKGRGIVALDDIAPGTIIESCPVLIIPHRDRFVLDQTIIFTYVFMWEKACVEQDLYKHTGRAAIALGLASLLNHSYTPNAEFISYIDDLILEIRSKSAIRRGEEITIDYQMDLWFDPV